MDEDREEDFFLQTATVVVAEGKSTLALSVEEKVPWDLWAIDAQDAMELVPDKP
ncbi:MAG TPA: hypothetical protein VMR34_01665 [Candidatus Saccharimonadales bacterium]|nr:hypothetical protein [Candidatus Saccharimonadales bacterium]